jgi:hypothetical protein
MQPVILSAASGRLGKRRSLGGDPDDSPPHQAHGSGFSRSLGPSNPAPVPLASFCWRCDRVQGLLAQAGRAYREMDQARLRMDGFLDQAEALFGPRGVSPPFGRLSGRSPPHGRPSGPGPF